ncbi:hypothetical protein [Dysgonomonas sp. ZJ709]|uniref:hypothetical protein n=1 Tax=Dysgonomonas sp. ZJ709 TaxID=2709797 RepID=UPI0013EB7DBD|nr:hypothetical protein [Dysgonomonas sp. ZJ709]
METNISRNYSKVGITRFISLKIFILILVFSIPEFISAQRSYNADDYWFVNGGGLTNRLHGGSNRGVLSWFGNGPSWQLTIQADRNFINPDWIFRRPNMGTAFPVLHSPWTTARIIGAGELQFSGGGRGLPNGGVAPDMAILTNGRVTIGTSTVALHDLFTVAGSAGFNLSSTAGNIGVQIRDFWNRGQGSIGTNTNHPFVLYSNNAGRIRLDADGSVIVFGRNADSFNTISQTNRNRYSLFVLGGVLSEDYAIGPRATWADHVFNKDYKLMDLNEVENFINLYNRLPDIPPASEVEADGYSLHDMNVKLLQKVEELTLYSIEQNKEIELLKKIVENLEKNKADKSNN